MYTFCYPDGTPYYVGHGKRARQTHLQRNSEANQVLREIEAGGGKMVKKTEEYRTREEAVARETELIRLHGRRIDGGLLCNQRIGDRGGVQGRRLSDEQRARISAAMRGNKNARGGARG